MGNLIHTVSGDIASFRSAARVPIESLKCHFLPVQAGSGDASPDNIRPISGWSGIEITHTGKNMIDASIFADPNYNITYNNGILTGTADNLFQKSFQNGKLVTNFKGKLHSTFSLSACTDGNQATSGNGLQPFFRYSSGNKTIYTYSNATQNYLKKSLSLYNYNQTAVPEFFSFSYWGAPNNIWHIKEFQWEMGDSVSDYEPYKGQTYNINWSNDVGTIYSGYVDIIKGELVAEYKLLTITGDENNLSYNWDGLLIPVPDSVSDNGSQIVIACSHTNNCIHGIDVWSTARGQNPNANTNNICVAGSAGSQLRFRKRDLDPDYTRDIELYKTWLRQQNANGTPLQIVYKLTIPVTYQLTPQQLKTFLDQNNIWSNTNDIIEVSYQIHDSAFIRVVKQRIITAPHIEAVASGNTSDSTQIAHFTTDLAAPIKSLKINFSPVQEGSGDPSPTNIRPIIGTNTIELTHTGINLLNCDTFTDGTADGITYTGKRDSNNNIESINIIGTKTTQNAFRNLNYTPRTVKWPPVPGSYATYAYSDQATIMIGGSPYAPADRNGNKYNDTVSVWKIYDLSKASAQGLTFGHTRIQVMPFSEGTYNINSVVYPMICLLSDYGCAFEPYKGKTYTINLPSTIYGGYIDLISGQLIQTHASIDLYNQTWTVRQANESSPYVFSCTLPFKIYSAPVTEQLCNIYPTQYISAWEYAVPGYFHIYTKENTSNFRVIYFAFNDINNLNDFQAWLINNNVQVVVKLDTPITYQLTPQTFQALRGVNNIWSKTNDNIEVSYWTH